MAEEDWLRQAVCRGMDTRLFFPPRSAPQTIQKTIGKVCGHCPVREECWAYAYRNKIRHGWWGGRPAGS